MKKATDDEMPEEIDFSNAVRGKYAARYALGSNIVMIRPEIFAAFPSEKAVNDALEEMMRSGFRSGPPSGSRPVARAARRRSAATVEQSANSR